MSTTPRIVSLLPSATEIVCALGFRDALVGRSHECDHPPGVERLPICSRPKLDPGAGSTEIDRRVREIVRDGLSVYAVREEVLRGLEPDLIVTQSQCEVCAVSRRDVERAVGEWTGRAPAVVSLEPNALEDVWADVERVAARLDVAERGGHLTDGYRDRMADVAARCAGAGQRPRVACIEWVEPLMAAGNWIPELVEMAGAQSLFGEPGRHSPWLAWERLREADPDVIVTMPCGFSMARTRADLHHLTGRPGWDDLAAVRGGRVFVTDGHHYFNRPGPRLVESLEILAEILHPGLFPPSHRGHGWARLG